MKDIYRIVFQDYKDCFLRIPLNITKENEYAKMVYGTANTAYFSIINGKVKDSGDGSAYIGLNAVYAKQLGLAQDELVTVTYLKSLPKLHTVHSVHRREDLDVLVLSKDKLEDKILQQIKVVWPGQAFPVWIGKNFYFNIKIEFLAPPSSVGILCEGTELDLRPQDDLNALKSFDYPLKENVVSNISTEPVEFRVCEMPQSLGKDPNSLSALVFTSNWPNCWGEIICDMWCTLSYAQGETAVEASLKGVHTSPNQSQVTRSRNLLVTKTVMTALGLTGNGYNVNVTLHGPKSKNQLPVPASAPQQNAVPQEPVFSGGLLKLVNEGEASLELALRLTPNAVYFHPNGILHLSHNVLVVGDRGSGRTTLAKEIIKRLSGIPHFVHVETVSCRSIVGKRPDACGRILGSALDRCFLCEPSILFLDDLECIAPHVTPNEEATAEGIHNARMGELLSNLIWEAGGHNGRGAGKVAVLATAHSPAALSASLVSPRGTHIFTTILSIPNLETDIRQKMLLAMLGCDSDKTNNNTLEKAVHDIALRTAGFVATDLTDLVHRAIFDALGRKAYEKTDMKETKPEVMLDNDNLDEEKEMGPHGVRVEDLESALSRTVPLSLHGTELVRWGENGKGEKVGGLWEDIGGLKEAKKKLEEAVLWSLKHPQLFKNLPLKPRRGMLLYGPPGTGKTRLVSSLVGHCGLRLINVKGPELLSKYIGASEEAVRNIFKKAYSARPCILFFDEFESLAPRRGHDSTGVTDRVVNQLLTQLDGVEEGVGDGMCVIAATTRPDLIDPALLRPGRLDSPILCPMPDEEDRISILHKLSHRLLLGKGVDLNELAKLTDGFTGADLQAVLYSSQLVSLKSGCNQDDHKHNKGLIVEWDQILQALKNTRPSLTKREVDKYERCYASLDGSGDFPIPDQKVSLA